MHLIWDIGVMVVLVTLTIAVSQLQRRVRWLEREGDRR